MSKDRFEPRPGRARNKGQRGEPGYLHAVLHAAARAGTPGLSRTTRRPGHSFTGSRLGRGSVAARMLSMPGRYAGLRARRAIVKVRLVRLRSNGLRAAKAHLQYVLHGTLTRDGERGGLYSSVDEHADGLEFLGPCRGDRHQFRLIVSPEDGAEYEELRPLIRRFMARMEQDLGTQLDWIAGDHFNTMHPHTHIMVRGKDDRGEDLVISPLYIWGGMRDRLAEIISIDLGPVTKFDLDRRRSIEVHAERLTRIDRELLAEMDQERIVTAGGRDTFDHAKRTGRLRKLSSLGLAEELGRGEWKLHEHMNPTLSELGVRVEIMRRMQAVISKSGVERGLSEQVIYRPGPDGAVTGRLLAQGLSEHAHRRQYLVIDGTDGRCHYVDVGDDEVTPLIPKGAIIRVGAREAGGLQSGKGVTADQQLVELDREIHSAAGEEVPARSRQAGPVRLQPMPHDKATGKAVIVQLLSGVTLESLPDYDGVTWLDRELITPSASLRDSGFGRDVSSALGRRRAWLIEQGLAFYSGRQFVCHPDMVEILEQREVHRIAERISRETGLGFRPARVGATIEGVVRRRLDLASGTSAMIETGFGFTLVPWQRSLDRAGRETLSGLVRRDGISWRFSRERGLHL